MNYDANKVGHLYVRDKPLLTFLYKLPLGNLSKTTVSRGFAALKVGPSCLLLLSSNPLSGTFRRT